MAVDGHDSRMLRKARAATVVIFFVNGAVFAAWATRIPGVQARLDLSAGELAAAVLGLEGGAVLGLPLGGLLVARIGSRRSLQAGFTCFPAALVGVAVAPGLGRLMLALAAMAAANSVVDVAMNAQGIELECRYGRPILSSLHAGHPIGLAVGGLAGALAAGAGVPVGAHLAAAAAVGLLAGTTATRWLVRESPDGDAPAFARPSRRLLLLGLVAFCAFMLDGAGCNWTAVHLVAERDAGEGLAAAGFTAFALAMALGRLRGDALVARFGRVKVVQGSGVVAALGATIAIAAPGAIPAIAGWAVFGLGLAALAPTVLGAAAGTPGVAAPVAIAAVSTVGYLGSFTGPPVIGALAQVASLPAALSLLIAGGAVTALLARTSLAYSPRSQAAPRA
jgi:MFS family permease